MNSNYHEKTDNERNEIEIKRIETIFGIRKQRAILRKKSELFINELNEKVFNRP